MSIDQIVVEMSKILIPALPYLIQGMKLGGKKASEKLGELGAEKLWNEISKRKKISRKLLIAVKELSKTPKDKSWQMMMKQEMKQILKSDPALLKEITLLLDLEISKQTTHAINNVDTTIEQSISVSSGKQDVYAVKNRNLVIRQNVKK